MSNTIQYKIVSDLGATKVIQYWDRNVPSLTQVETLNCVVNGITLEGEDLDRYIYSKTPLNIVTCINDPITLERFTTARQFLNLKGIPTPIGKYVYSMYNATTKQPIGDIFDFGNWAGHVVKVNQLGKVIEWYEFNVVVDGVKTYGVSRDITTGAVLETYMETSDGTVKLDKSGTTVYNHHCELGKYPQEIGKHLDYFVYAPVVSAWSIKANGDTVVYYRKDLLNAV